MPCIAWPRGQRAPSRGASRNRVDLQVHGREGQVWIHDAWHGPCLVFSGLCFSLIPGPQSKGLPPCPLSTDGTPRSLGADFGGARPRRPRPGRRVGSQGHGKGPGGSEAGRGSDLWGRRMTLWELGQHLVLVSGPRSSFPAEGGAVLSPPRASGRPSHHHPHSLSFKSREWFSEMWKSSGYGSW